MKATKRFLLLLTVTGILLSLPTQVFAKSKTRQAAIKAYRKFLSQDRIYIVPANKAFWLEGEGETTYSEFMAVMSTYDKDSIGYTLDHDDDGWYAQDVYLRYSKPNDVRFALAYIDDDQIPELIVHRPASKHCECAAVFTYRKHQVVRVDIKIPYYYSGYRFKITGYYKKKGVFVHRIVEDDHMIGHYKLKSGKAKDLNVDRTMSGIYNVNGKYVNKTKYNAALRKITGGAKLSKFKWYPNTEGNRKRHLK